MSSFIKVASEQELEFGGVLLVDIDDKEIALFNIQGAIYAIDDRCSHAEAPLSDGEVFGCEVECPLHGARFDLTTGNNLTPPADEPVRTYEVKIEEGDIYIKLD